MELLRQNFLQTTTQIAVDSNTAGAEYLLRRDTTYQYATSGYTGATKTTIRISFDETKTVSRIALLAHNLKAFRMYYNGATANTFALTSGDTTASLYASNSATSQYFQFTPVACTSVSFDLEDTMVAGVERAIGYMVISDVLHPFEREPPAKGYKPRLDPKDVNHELSDGGRRIQWVAEKYTTQLTFNRVSTSEKNLLRSVWKSHVEMIFVPFGTTTAWDEVIFPCVWEGTFDFEEFADDAVNAGHKGKINLLETPE